MAGGQGEGPVAAIAAKLRQLADWIACAMFAAVFVIFNYKIFTRYFEHDEAVWADEVLVILFIWIIF
jgi:TRAP-type C4-dicarboxylate transport system permease small subunit